MAEKERQPESRHLGGEITRRYLWHTHENAIDESGDQSKWRRTWHILTLTDKSCDTQQADCTKYPECPEPPGESKPTRNVKSCWSAWVRCG